MRVLLDENIPHDFAPALTGHTVSTVQGLGWAGVKNGELLGRASGLFDAFITMDRKLEREHALAKLPFGILILRASSNRVQALLPLVDAALDVLSRLEPGAIHHVG